MNISHSNSTRNTYIQKRTKKIYHTYNIFYNKCALYAFNLKTRKYVNRNNYYFIFGKEYKYDNRLLNKENIGLVLFDNMAREKVSNAINWLDRLRK